MIAFGITSLVLFVTTAFAVLVLGLVTSWVDRKVTARVQARVGPPWFQPVADIMKLMGKETLAPEGSGRTVFLLAPLFGLAGAAVTAALLGHVIIRPDEGFVGDIIVFVYLLIIPAIALIIGASASGNPIAIVGASREMKLVLAYELPALIVIAMIIYKSGFDFQFSSILASQAQSGWHLWSLSGIIGFIVLLLTTQAKLGLVPFDMPEAEQEIMGGIITEYSGPPLAVIKMTKMMIFVIMPLFMVTLLMGGIKLSGISILWSILKYVVIIVLIVLIRNTNPRIRIDQAVKFFWGIMSVLALIGLILAFAGY